MQTSDNILTQTAPPKLPAKPSYGKSSKATQIGHFRRFCIGGTKGKPPKKKADLRGLKNNLRKSHDIFISMRLKCKQRTTFRRKLAPPKLPAKPSYGKSSKATQIGHFRRFCIGGTKGKPPKKKADLRGLKNNLRKSHDIFISMRLKCKHRTTF